MQSLERFVMSDKSLNILTRIVWVFIIVLAAAEAFGLIWLIALLTD